MFFSHPSTTNRTIFVAQNRVKLDVVDVDVRTLIRVLKVLKEKQVSV